VNDESGGHWTEDDEFPIADWQDQVANDDTRQSYADWVTSQRGDTDDDPQSVEVDLRAQMIVDPDTLLVTVTISTDHASITLVFGPDAPSGELGVIVDSFKDAVYGLIDDANEKLWNDIFGE